MARRGGLDSTYEGLKLPGDEPHEDGLRRLDSTYEGLKPRIPGTRHREMHSLDSTYEGLKPRSSTGTGGTRNVWTVPMRA